MDGFYQDQKRHDSDWTEKIDKVKQENVKLKKCLQVRIPSVPQTYILTLFMFISQVDGLWLFVTGRVHVRIYVCVYIHIEYWHTWWYIDMGVNPPPNPPPPPNCSGRWIRVAWTAISDPHVFQCLLDFERWLKTGGSTQRVLPMGFFFDEEKRPWWFFCVFFCWVVKKRVVFFCLGWVFWECGMRESRDCMHRIRWVKIYSR